MRLTLNVDPSFNVALRSALGEFVTLGNGKINREPLGAPRHPVVPVWLTVSFDSVCSCVTMGVFLCDCSPNGRLVTVSGDGSVPSCGGTGFHGRGVVECYISARIPSYAGLARQRQRGMVGKHGGPGGGGRFGRLPHLPGASSRRRHAASSPGRDHPATTGWKGSPSVHS